jgi:hypothetical protein
MKILGSARAGLAALTAAAVAWCAAYLAPIDAAAATPASPEGCYSTPAERRSLVSRPGVAPQDDAPARAVIRVGPTQVITRVADAARIAKSGDVVEIEAGEYLDDVASWPQDNLVIRAVGGHALMISLGRASEAKAIWVIKGNNVIIENIGFFDARVPNLNGAGIRHEGGRLSIRHSVFARNEMGLLSWDNPAGELEIVSSEFCGNAVLLPGTPRIGHQLYVGKLGRLMLRDSYVHGGTLGHLVKTRARENHIYNNRLTDEAGGRASYELEFPNGGIAYVIGNIIQQSATTDNPTLVSFGAEGYAWPRAELYLVNNTFIDDRARNGRFLDVRPGADVVRAVNNLLIGGDRIRGPDGTALEPNAAIDRSHVEAAQHYEYRLKQSSPVAGRAADAGTANGVALKLDREYAHPIGSRPVSAQRISPGALQELAR